MIRFGRALLRQHKDDSALYTRIIDLFGRQGMIDLTLTFGDYVMTALVLNAVDQQLQPDRKPLLPSR